tara:strand:+ start:472 stop:681 length:210 start_codon:yes stop_codon:yes gene_type:complete
MEQVSTGGVVTFNYKDGDRKRASDEMKNSIKRAYEDADIREKREKKNRLIWIIVAILFILMVVGFVFIR